MNEWPNQLRLKTSSVGCCKKYILCGTFSGPPMRGLQHKGDVLQTTAKWQKHFKANQTVFIASYVYRNGCKHQ